MDLKRRAILKKYLSAYGYEIALLRQKQKLTNEELLESLAVYHLGEQTAKATNEYNEVSKSTELSKTIVILYALNHLIDQVLIPYKPAVKKHLKQRVEKMLLKRKKKNVR